MVKNILVVTLLFALMFTSWRLAEVENQRYALMLGMCPDKRGLQLPDLKCLDDVETRIGWVWNLYYGLAG